MKAKKAVLVALALTGAFALAACDNGKNNEPLDDAALSGVMLADFSDGEADAFFASDGWTNGDPFNVTWDSGNIDYSDGAAKLSITAASSTAEIPYLGGELRTYQHFGYGDYSVRMKPAKVTGTASAFFTYTGPTEEDDNGDPNPHDEIDIEFLGSDTTKVQFNYFTNGVGGHEHMYDLGFDASVEYHDYGFRWAEDYIVWFVDGKPVYKVEASAKNPLPSTPGRILMNHWSGTKAAEGWMGKYTGGESTSSYAAVKTSALPIGEIPEKPDVPTGDIDWTAIDPVALEFASSNGKHTLTQDGTATKVVYTEIGNDYSNISADITTVSAEKNWLHITLRNNATDGTLPIVRVDVLDENDGHLESAATMNGKSVYTDLEWGGSYFNNIPAGEDVEAVVYFKGTAAKLAIMFDSTHYGDDTAYSGDVTVSDVKFARLGEIEQPGTPDEPDTPVTPPDISDVPTEGWTSISYGGFDGWGQYDIDKTDGLTISHEEGKSGYKCCGMTLADSYSWVSLNLKNNSDVAAVVRIDIKHEQNGGAIEQVLPASDNIEVVASEGCAIIQLDANETLDLAFKIKDMTVNQFVVFLNSTSDEVGAETGSITISDMQGIVAGGTQTPDIPETPEVPDGESVALTFGSTNEYTVDKDGEAATEINVTYDAVAGNSYMNIQAQAADLAADNDTFSLKITNNGTGAVRIRVDLIGERQVTVGDNTAMDVCNLSANATGGTDFYTDTTWGGTMIILAAGEEVSVIIKYSNTGEMGAVQRVQLYLDSSKYDDEETHGGNVTFGEFKFTNSQAADDDEAPEVAE